MTDDEKQLAATAAVRTLLYLFKRGPCPETTQLNLVIELLACALVSANANAEGEPSIVELSILDELSQIRQLIERLNAVNRSVLAGQSPSSPLPLIVHGPQGC